jgi:transposase-like protein
MREMSVAEQRYKAVLAVIADGRTVTEVARDWGVSRQTMHGWLARYEVEGLEGPLPVEVMVLEMRRSHPYLLHSKRR